MVPFELVKNWLFYLKTTYFLDHYHILTYLSENFKYLFLTQRVTMPPLSAPPSSSSYISACYGQPYGCGNRVFDANRSRTSKAGCLIILIKWVGAHNPDVNNRRKISLVVLGTIICIDERNLAMRAANIPLALEMIRQSLHSHYSVRI